MLSTNPNVMQYVANIQRILLTPASSRTDTNIHYSSSPRHNQTLGWDFPVMVTKWSNIIFALEWRISPPGDLVTLLHPSHFGILWKLSKSFQVGDENLTCKLINYSRNTSFNIWEAFLVKIKTPNKHHFMVLTKQEYPSSVFSVRMCKQIKTNPIMFTFGNFESQIFIVFKLFPFLWTESFVCDAFWPERPKTVM